MKKRKGKFTLTEALDLLDEAIVAGDYSLIVQDDDIPTGNIVYGPRYKRNPYYNRLNKFNTIWDQDDSEWKWDIFPHSIGMEDFDNYHNSLGSMKNLFPKKTWYNMWKHMKNVPDDEAIHPNQLGKYKEDNLELDVTKGGKIKDTKLKT